MGHVKFWVTLVSVLWVICPLGGSCDEICGSCSISFLGHVVKFWVTLVSILWVMVKFGVHMVSVLWVMWQMFGSCGICLLFVH